MDDWKKGKWCHKYGLMDVDSLLVNTNTHLNFTFAEFSISINVTMLHQSLLEDLYLPHWVLVRKTSLKINKSAISIYFKQIIR